MLEMEWNQIDFDLMAWRIPITKNGDFQTIPLTPLAMEILRRRKNAHDAHERWVFPSDQAGRVSGVRGHLVSPRESHWVLERAGIENLRIHDLRSYPESRIIRSKNLSGMKACPLCGSRLGEAASYSA